MFGYFKFYRQYTDNSVYRCYKNYYCGLCLSLQQNYGTLARFILSYDVTLLAIIVKSHSNPNIERFKCIGKQNEKKAIFVNDDWKKLAAINILLAAAKLEDDISDDNSLKAKIIKTIFNKKIYAAKNDFPDINKTIKDGYKTIQNDEKNNRSLEQLSTDFSKLMTNITSVFSVESWQIDYVAYISKWLYFIDALDDLNDDIEKKRFNPFSDYCSKNNLTNKYYQEIAIFLDKIKNEAFTVFCREYNNSIEEVICRSVLENTIPIITEKVLTKNE